VSAGSIVIHFDVFEYRLSHVLPGGESLTMNSLDLERVKEALGASIIVTTPFGTYTAQQAMLLDQSLGVTRAILNTVSGSSSSLRDFVLSCFTSVA
jgi:hypothetical protein